MKAKKHRRGSTIVRVISTIIIIILLFGVIGFFIFFTNGFTSDFKAFYVEYDEKKILENVNEFVMPVDKDVRFNVKYTLPPMSKDTPKGFSVKIVPNITDKTNFDFTVDGLTYNYSGESDLTAAFDIKQYDDYFILNIPKYLTIQDFLGVIYKDKQVVVPETGMASEQYYSLLIFSHNETQLIKINFSLYVYVKDIEFENGGIVI